uniref:Signal peptide-containing protein n=1 Tax=Colletotrichum fructicola (strain Nara gc5) TaxID=1213859 RepID=L2FCL0_COLFN
MSLPVAIQSAIFYYLACTPCNEMKAFRKAKKKAKEEREVKRRIEMEQPGLYRHPDPFHTNPYWAEEMAMGPHLPKKSASKNASQRGLQSAGRASTAASFGCASTAAESTGPVSPTISQEQARKLSGDGWNRTLYQREDEELWGHNLSGMGHKLMDNIVGAGKTAGRYVEEKLGREKAITDEDRENFYTTPRNPPVNDYHPPIVGSKPSRPDALKWMLQPPPPAKLMEGRVPVTRTHSTSTVGSRRTMASEEPPLDRLSTVSSKNMSNRSRSLSLESEVSSDGELVERRRRARARRVPATPEETSSDEDDYVQHRAWDSLGHASPPRRPKLETITSSRSNTRQALKARPNGTRPNATAKDADITPKASTNPIVLKSDENTPTTPATIS